MGCWREIYLHWGRTESGPDISDFQAAVEQSQKVLFTAPMPRKSRSQDSPAPVTPATRSKTYVIRVSQVGEHVQILSYPGKPPKSSRGPRRATRPQLGLGLR